MKILKREIALFLILLVCLSGLVCLFMVLSETDNLADSFYALLFVYCPLAAAFITRIITGGNIKKLGWKFGNCKYLFIALSIPLLLGIIVYGFGWATHIGTVRDDFKIGLESDLPKSLDFFLFVIIGLLLRTIGAFGEEVGWRGFLTPRLYKLFGLKTTSILVGLIWIIWHIPLLLMSDYGGELSVLKIIFSTVSLISISFVLTWIRIRSGSLWTGVLYHASHNFFIQNVFDELFIQNSSKFPFLSEMGIGLCITSILTALIFWQLKNNISIPENYQIK